MPLAVNELLITGAGGFAAATVSVNVAVPVPPALVALKLMLEVPVALGVPEMTPVEVLTERPDGKPVALKLVGVFVAVIV